MDAVKFLREAKRMCDQHTEPCNTCAANEFCGFTPEVPSEFGETTQMQKMVELVEMWSKEHPRKTRQDKLLEQWPNAQVVSGVLQICPKSVMGPKGWRKDGCGGVQCATCCREFWTQEVE